MIDQILAYNKEFVANKGYEQYVTDKYPDKKLAVLSCMDTRLTELLPAALGLKNGDAKIIKNAGGLVISAFDSAMRSLIVAIYELGVNNIMVVALVFLFSSISILSVLAGDIILTKVDPRISLTEKAGRS